MSEQDTTSEPDTSREPEAPSEPEIAKAYQLQQFPEKLAVVRLGPGAEVPEWAESSSLFSVTATATETSLICATRSVPAKVPSQKPLTAYAVQGPVDEDDHGVLASLLAPLAEEGIKVFTISTFDTDWILVPLNSAEGAVGAWRRRGHTVAAAVPVIPPSPSKPKSKSKTGPGQNRKNQKK